jgi:hypothetical protein
LKIAIQGLGLVIVLITLGQWSVALQADYGELDVVGGLAFPVAWGITGYGLFRLREWGRQLMLMICAGATLMAVLSVFMERRIGGEALGTLLFGVNVALLLMRRSAVAVIRRARQAADREPQVEGWLAGSAALIVFGAVWYAVLIPITAAIWNWYWVLSTVAKVVLFIVAGTYFAGLVWLTFVVPFSVAGHFFEVAARGGAVSEEEETAIESGAGKDWSDGSFRTESLEILPRLRERYPRYIRPEITSVRFGQTQDRCYLEVHTAETVGGYLRNEAMTRKDLGFVSADVGDDRPFFDPAESVEENARRFITEFDEISIVNCTDLFTPDAPPSKGADPACRYSPRAIVSGPQRPTQTRPVWRLFSVRTASRIRGLPWMKADRWAFFHAKRRRMPCSSVEAFTTALYLAPIRLAATSLSNLPSRRDD